MTDNLPAILQIFEDNNIELRACQTCRIPYPIDQLYYGTKDNDPTGRLQCKACGKEANRSTKGTNKRVAKLKDSLVDKELEVEKLKREIETYEAKPKVEQTAADKLDLIKKFIHMV